MTRKYLFDLLKGENLPNLDKKLESLKNRLISSEGLTDAEIDILKSDFAHFKSEVKRRWTKAHYKEDQFLNNNQSWLEGTFAIPVADHTVNRPGRPSKPFEELAERSKRRKTKDLRSCFDEDIIVHAAQVELRKTGKRDASNVLKDIMKSPTRASKYKKAYYCTKSPKDKIIRLTPHQATQMFVDADLTRSQYNIVRRMTKNILPCYSLLQKEKKKSYPPPDSYTVTSTSAEAQLQPLVDLTVRRLSEYLEEVLKTLKDQERETLQLISKWGCDGSQQAQYKQKFDSEMDSDMNLFQSCFVPLKLVCGVNCNKTLWENPTPSSPRFCRPIKFKFVKETTDITQQEIINVNNSINSLNSTIFDLFGKQFKVKHKFIMTMVDGKVCNAATGTTSTSRCYICNATSKDFNDIDKFNTIDTDIEAIQFGLSVLHARIRLFESIIHLAYKLPVKKYRERKTDTEKQLEKERKQEIQTRFRNETGLLIDMPKANFGNTNDGNTSRRFFEDPKLASEITGIDFDLIYRIKVILEVISSGYKVDPEKYDIYAKETARLYVNLYPWHPMTPTMHKILIHGSVIIKNALLPIGQLTEEAAEARNKHFRSYRQDFARKFSRESCNKDVFHRLLLSSDPLMSSMRYVSKRHKKVFLPEALQMLMPSDPNPENSSESEEENLTLDNSI